MRTAARSFIVLIGAWGPLLAAEPLTLRLALDRSAAGATTAEIARARLAKALAVERQAWSLLKPAVNLTGSYGTQSATDAPYGSPSVQTRQGEAAVSVTLFNAAAYPGIRGADAQVAGQRAASRELRRGLAFSVTGAFLEVLTAEQVRSVARERVQVAHQLLDEAKARKDAGLALTSDVSRAALEVANAELELTKADRGITTTRLALIEVLGGGEDPGALQRPDFPLIPPAAGSEASIDQAIRERGDLVAAARTIEVNAASVRQAEDGFWPTISARAAVRGQEDNAARPADSPVWSAALQAQWSLYDGGLRKAQAEERAAQGRELRANLKALQLSVGTQVRTAVADLNAADTAVQQAETAQAAARTNADETTGRFRAGLATANDVADAALRAAQAAVELERNRIAALKARFGLRQSLGWWPLDAQDPAEDE